MKHRAHLLVARAMLVVLLATLLSPSLGWQMVATHEQLEQAGLSLSNVNDEHDHEEHGDAHGSIGHLLTHMPSHLAAMTWSTLLHPAAFDPPAYRFSLLRRSPEPPFRPPRPFSLV